jgi:hypothetical protein
MTVESVATTPPRLCETVPSPHPTPPTSRNNITIKARRAVSGFSNVRVAVKELAGTAQFGA